MPRYPLNALGAEELEQLVQSLLKKIVGNGTVTFGAGPDGAREATFVGTAPYPSVEQRWSGHWIFQVKHHDVERIGGDRARRQLLEDLRGELRRVQQLYGRCDNYVLATNVPLSSQSEIGTHDRAAKLASEFADTICNVHVWGYDELCRFLDADASVRAAYRQFLTTGDMIERLLGERSLLPLDEAIQMYLAAELRDERYAQLDQAGDVGPDAVALERIFTDLDVLPRRSEAEYWAKRGYFEDESPGSALELLLSGFPRVVLIGGPGQGKSTLGQFLGQIHRATLLGRLDELAAPDLELEPLVPRIPFRIVLREMAQWMDRRSDDDGASVEQYAASRVMKAAAGCEVRPQGIVETVRNNPTLFIFDGLDEVVDAAQRRAVLHEVDAFVERAETVLRADVQIVGSSRPNSYSNDFHPQRFMHLELQQMDRERVDDYVSKWLSTRNLDDARAERVRETFAESAADPQLELLLTTPLQVSIVIYVILSGGRPSRQRESLFNDYVDVIYRRERAKHRSIIETEKDVLIGLHQYLGYLLHRRAGDGTNVESTLDGAEFEQEVRRYLKHINPYVEDETLARELATLVSEARERLVLLVENSEQQFGFELRSLQEYFAASHLVETSATTEQRYQRFMAIATSSHWRNTALFFAGRVGRAFRGEAPQLLEACRAIDRVPPDTLIGRGATLARALAVDRVFGSNAGLQRSAIEESLAQLEGDPYVWGSSNAAGELGRLTRSDQTTHLLPALAVKLNALDLARMRTAVETLSHECRFPFGSIAEILRRRSTEGSMRDRAATIATLLQIDRSAETQECARAFAAEADDESFASAFWPLTRAGRDDPLLASLDVPNRQWRLLAARGRSAGGAAATLRQLAPFGAPADVREGWAGARLVLQLEARVRGLSHGDPLRDGHNISTREIEMIERIELADSFLEAIRSVLAATMRLKRWEPPAVPLTTLWGQAAAAESLFPNLLQRCVLALRAAGTPGHGLMLALRDRDVDRFAAASEMIGRFYVGETGEAIYGRARQSIARSIRSDAERAAYLLGIPMPEPDTRTEPRFGVTLERFGATVGRGVREARVTDGDAAVMLRCAADAVGRRWPGLPVRKLMSLLQLRDATGGALRGAAFAYVDAVVKRSRDRQLASESAAIVALRLLSSSEDDPRVFSLLPHITSSPQTMLPLTHTAAANLRPAVAKLVRHAHADGACDPAAVHGAAALVVWLTARDWRRVRTVDDIDPPAVEEVVAFLNSDDETVKLAGLRMLSLLDADEANRLLVRSVGRILDGDGPELRVTELKLAPPEDPNLRAEVIATLSSLLGEERAPARGRYALLRHLSRVADAQEAEIACREQELGLPLATPR